MRAKTVSPTTDRGIAVHPHIARGRATIAQEIAGLEAVAGALDGKFVRAVELIGGCAGRVIVTGMGKSGHVARKIAATLASTGTPAYFVHPAEASHGDLGMITPQDVLLMLSNSGETPELEDMIGYAKRFSIPIIALVRRAESMLVEAAEIPVVLPGVAEASPTGAPTTSTLMMLAWGDALAMALLELRGFTPEDFKTFHPGGRLGRQLLKVADLMHGAEYLPLVTLGENMREVLYVMTAKTFGCAGVVDAAGRLAGIITDGDLRRHADKDLLAHMAREIMTANPQTIRPHRLAAEALNRMNGKNITGLFVVGEDGIPVGILHIHDLLRSGVV